MAKRKSKGGWPEDWREQIARDDEEFLGALKEIADPVELCRLWNSTKKNGFLDVPSGIVEEPE